MSMSDRIAGVRRLLGRLQNYESLIMADGFEPETIDDMKGNAKDLCNAAKVEIDNIKAEIDLWS